MLFFSGSDEILLNFVPANISLAGKTPKQKNNSVAAIYEYGVWKCPVCNNRVSVCVNAGLE